MASRFHHVYIVVGVRLFIEGFVHGSKFTAEAAAAATVLCNIPSRVGNCSIQALLTSVDQSVCRTSRRAVASLLET